jgi:signal transduction histidine kinase
LGKLFDNLFHSIRSRLIAGVVVLHAVMMGLVVFDMMTRQQDFMQAQLANEGISLTSTLSANTPSWLLSRDLNGLGELIGSLKSVKHLQLALILDADGEVQASTDPALLGLTLEDTPSVHLMNALKNASGRANSQLLHDGMVDTLAEVTSGGKRIGYTRVILDASPVQAELDAVTSKGAAYALTAIVLGGLLAWLLVRSMVRHLEKLSRAADSIAAGNLKVELPLSSSKDEVGRLTQDFSLMAEALERDIQERELLEENLRRINETLEHRVQEEVARNREMDHLLIQQSRLAAMGEMARNIAHHWRQPLNTLSLQLTNIEDEFDYQELTKERLHEDIVNGQKMIRKMSGIIDNFRDFFAQGQEANSPFNLQKSVDSTLKLIEYDFQKHHITLLPEPDSAVEAMGCPHEFSRILLGILNNAKEAILVKAENGGWIRIRVEGKNGLATVSVHDNGNGIPDNLQQRIFEPYFSTKEMGTGIGLYLAKTGLEQMGGTIRAANIPGSGACFTLSLAQPAPQDPHQ